MRIDIATLFPEMCDMVLDQSIIGRARKNGLLTFVCHNIRDYTNNKQKQVDDYPYGGGRGMVMQADPIYRCYLEICRQVGKHPHVIYMSPQGKTLTQRRAVELSEFENILILCGHYEGVDERIIEEIVDEEISIGDYVVTGGELPALVLADAIARLRPGVLAETVCFEEESHYSALLEYPHYSRPAEWNGRPVPDVLLSGHHANIQKWRREQQVARTFEKRPELLKKAELSRQDRAVLEKCLAEREDRRGTDKSR